MAVNFLGTYDFQQSAPERWSVRSDGMDSLTVPMRGSVGMNADAYMAALTRWQASSIDGQMFLDTWDNTDDRSFPQIDLKYVGCRGGFLPVPKASVDFANQTANYTVDDIQIDILYRAPAQTMTWFESAPPNLKSPKYSSSLPTNDRTLIKFLTIRAVGVSGTLAQIEGAFPLELQQQDYSIETIVPFHWFRCSATWQLILRPLYQV